MKIQPTRHNFELSLTCDSFFPSFTLLLHFILQWCCLPFMLRCISILSLFPTSYQWTSFFYSRWLLLCFFVIMSLYHFVSVCFLFLFISFLTISLSFFHLYFYIFFNVSLRCLPFHTGEHLCPSLLLCNDVSISLYISRFLIYLYLFPNHFLVHSSCLFFIFLSLNMAFRLFFFSVYLTCILSKAVSHNLF